jgi:hypothetical protein
MNPAAGRALALLLVAAALTACDRVLPPRTAAGVPDIEDARRTYADHGITAEFRYSGNVLELVVQQSSDQLRRGGQLWARVGPYIYLFSPATRELFEAHTGLAGVRVVTMSDGREVARALLVRDALNEIGWRRSRAVLAEALDQGTERPSTMDRLVQFGEQTTQFEYNPEFVPPR